MQGKRQPCLPPIQSVRSVSLFIAVAHLGSLIHSYETEKRKLLGRGLLDKLRNNRPPNDIFFGGDIVEQSAEHQGTFLELERGEIIRDISGVAVVLLAMDACETCDFCAAGHSAPSELVVTAVWAADARI